MIRQDALTSALREAQRSAGRCTRFCAVSGTVIPGVGYDLYHVGIGIRDTDAQRPTGAAVAVLTHDTWAARLTAWIAGLHAGKRYDLSTGKDVVPA